MVPVIDQHETGLKNFQGDLTCSVGESCRLDPVEYHISGEQVCLNKTKQNAVFMKTEVFSRVDNQ